MTKKEIVKRLEKITETTMSVTNPKNTYEFIGVVNVNDVYDLIEEIKKEIEKENEMMYETARKNYDDYMKGQKNEN